MFVCGHHKSQECRVPYTFLLAVLQQILSMLCVPSVWRLRFRQRQVQVQSVQGHVCTNRCILHARRRGEDVDRAVRRIAQHMEPHSTEHSKAAKGVDEAGKLLKQGKEFGKVLGMVLEEACLYKVLDTLDGVSCFL